MKSHRIVGVLLACSLLAPVLASAQTVTGSSTVDIQIQSLLSQITMLQQQLKALIQSVAPSATSSVWHASSTPPTVSGGAMMPCPTFGRDLSQGSTGNDVMQLQQMLSGDGFLPASSTGFFGALTVRALEAFQVHFGIAASSSTSGFFGPLTRNFLVGHCGGEGEGNGDGHNTGSSTPPMMHPMIPISTSTPFWGGPDPRMLGTSTSGWMTGSSTMPLPPCANNDNQGAAPVLFVPHVILPMMPCNNGQGSGEGSGQDH